MMREVFFCDFCGEQADETFTPSFEDCNGVTVRFESDSKTDDVDACTTCFNKIQILIGELKNVEYS